MTFKLVYYRASVSAANVALLSCMYVFRYCANKYSFIIHQHHTPQPDGMWHPASRSSETK